MGFQFPASPALGQVYNAAPGVQYTWNGTGWSPTTSVPNVAEGLFPDGTLAAPAISWINNPTMGWYRHPTLPNKIVFAADGVEVLGLAKDSVISAVPVTLLSTAPLVVDAAATFGVKPRLAGFTSSTGWYDFGANTFGSQLRIMGANNNSTAGTEIAMLNPSLESMVRINMLAQNYALWQAQLGFGVAHGGPAGATDFVMGYNNLSLPQFHINGGFDSGLANILNAPLQITSAAVNFPGLTLHRTSNVVWGISVLGDHHLYFGSHFKTGPAAIYTWSMRISVAGEVGARSFAPVVFAATSVAPMTGALSDVLKLRGVRCFNTETQKPDIRVELDDLERVFPELVIAHDEARGINYAVLAAPLIEAVRELNDRDATLLREFNERSARLERAVEELTTRVKMVERKL